MLCAEGSLGTSVDFHGERRRGRRFNLALSCRVCPVSTENVEIAGTVINISRSGILVGIDSAEISTLVEPDAIVRVVIDLPRHPLYSPRCLECITRVVRIVTAKAQTQVAFEIEQIQGGWSWAITLCP